MEPEQFAARLLDWFEMHGRHTLPWQVKPTPYRVWISEVMLQQTQVATVLPYYGRFMERFPEVQTLASAPLDEVLHLWTGLGYYARARNLLACAQILVGQNGGEFPKYIEDVMKLPGIGRSTAGAILAISRGERHPILDGNVKRVMARVFGIAGDPSSNAVLAELWTRSDACTPANNVAAYTQAIMDLGATLCTRARPACTLCPMVSGCVAAVEGRQSELPGKKRRLSRGSREVTLLIARMGSYGSTAILVERRASPGIWGGLWSPPQFNTETEAFAWCSEEFRGATISQSLPAIEHAFTHFDLRLKPLMVQCNNSPRIRDSDDQLWYQLDSPPKIGLPQPIRQLFERLRTTPSA